MDILEQAETLRLEALDVLEKTRLIAAWESIGATVNLVGSLKSGLMVKNRDIDLHIYTDRLDIRESFSVMERLAAELPVKEVHYMNLIDTEEECIEWHALYDSMDGNIWKFDMIHIRRGSKYDGRVELVTDKIIKKLTPEIRQTILELKSQVPDGSEITGIEIYRAVFEGKVKNYEELLRWRGNVGLTNTLEWLP